MGDFHITISPGIMNDMTKPVIVAFDEPENAEKVIVTLWEADRWSIDEDNKEKIRESTKNDMIAKFKGSIVDYEFKGKLLKCGTKSKKRPLLKVKFDGDNTVHDLRIPQNGNEHEQGVFEIVASVSGKIDGQNKNYRTKVPSFIRQFKNHRPVVAIITGKGGSYFKHARKYWRKHADGMFLRASVQEVLEFLRSAPEERGYGTWGEVNVVSHGNEWEWIVRLFRKGKPNPSHLKLSDLKKYAGDGRLLPRPDKDRLDKKSRVVLRACVIGNNKDLLDEIRMLFGGEATLFAPKFIQWYRYTEESFREQFYFYRPGTKIPKDSQSVRALSTKYHTYGISDADWKKLLKKKEKLEPESMGPLWIDYEGFKPTMNQARSDIRDLFYNEDKIKPEQRLGTEFDDWLWKIKISKEKGKSRYRATGRGCRRRIEVRRPLRDAEGELVNPDLSVSWHYGRSPA